MDGNGTTGDETGTHENVWSDAHPSIARANGASAVGSEPEYAIISGPKVSIRATVSVYDRYGNPIGAVDRIDITTGSSGADPASTPSTSGDQQQRHGRLPYLGGSHHGRRRHSHRTTARSTTPAARPSPALRTPRRSM